MRAYLATTVAAACACATALVLPIAFAAAAPAASRHDPVRDLRSVSDARGATDVIALTPLTGPSSRSGNAPVPEGVTSRSVRPFSMLGITWNDATVGLDGTVQVRTRSRSSGRWSGWQTLETSEDAPDLDSPERAGTLVRGGTAPLWVGDADGVRVRVVPRTGSGGRAGDAAGLPKGLRVDLVDPGTPGAAAHRSLATVPDEGPDPYPWNDGGESADPGDSAQSGESGQSGGWGDSGGLAESGGVQAATTPRPRIVTRAGWGADESLRDRSYDYTGPVRAVFVHHTATGNNYACAQAPAIIRGIYRYHVKSEGWRDIGYNFLIDKCGTVYEGRAGGVTRSVLGAHTLGFNTDTTGIALLGTFTKANPATRAVQSLERLAAWKLSLTGVRADATTTLTSRGSNKYRSGAHVRFAVISGHRDAFTSECPGTRLYRQLPAIRKVAARLQAR